MTCDFNKNGPNKRGYQSSKHKLRHSSMYYPVSLSPGSLAPSPSLKKVPINKQTLFGMFSSWSAKCPGSHDKGKNKLRQAKLMLWLSTILHTILPISLAES